MTLSYVVSGFTVGLLVGLTGVGGGALMTPILTLLFGIPPSVAVGTDLAFAAATKTAGTFAHRFKGTVRWDIVRRLSYGTLPAALITTLLLKHFGAISADISTVIRYCIAVSVFLTVIALLFRGKLQAWFNSHPDRRRDRHAGDGFFDRRWRHRRDFAGATVSAPVAGGNRRHRYCLCGAVDGHRGMRPLVAGFDRLEPARRIIAGFGARHHHRLVRSARGAGKILAWPAGHCADKRRFQADLLRAALLEWLLVSVFLITRSLDRRTPTER